MEVPAAIHVPLIVKVLSFDRQLRVRAGRALVVAVAYQGGNRASVTIKDDIVQLLDAERESIDGLTITAVAIDLDREELDAGLRARHPTVLYVTPLRGVDVTRIAAAARAARVTTVATVPRDVSRGLALGVGLLADRPRLLVNLTAARLEGADFSAELLKLAQVIP